MQFIRLVFGYGLAAAVTTALAAAFHTQMVIKALEQSGASISMDQRLGMTAGDLVGLAPQFGAVIAIGLLAGFIIAALLKRVLTPLAPIAYPLAGAAAVGVALTVMSMAFDGITPIAGARSTLGFALQCLAGAVGGLVFALVGARKGA